MTAKVRSRNGIAPVSLTVLDRPDYDPVMSSSLASEGAAPVRHRSPGGPPARRVQGAAPARHEGARRALGDAHRLRHVHHEIFDEAGIPVLLVGDSAGNNVYGFETAVPVTVDHLVPLCRAVARLGQARHR